MRTTPLVALLFLSGCASAAVSEPAESPARIIPTGETLDVRVSGNEEATLKPVAAPPQIAWQALPRVFEQLQIPVTHIDPPNRVMGNRQFSVSRTLAGESLQRYLSCGSTMTGSVTSTHEVRLSLLLEVLPRADGMSHLRPRVHGAAFSRQGVSRGGPIACASTGRLEARLAEMLNEFVSG